LPSAHTITGGGERASAAESDSPKLSLEIVRREQRLAVVHQLAMEIRRPFLAGRRNDLFVTSGISERLRTELYNARIGFEPNLTWKSETATRGNVFYSGIFLVVTNPR
jgi:hypothetical protein